MRRWEKKGSYQPGPAKEAWVTFPLVMKTNIKLTREPNKNCDRGHVPYFSVDYFLNNAISRLSSPRKGMISVPYG